MAHSSCSSLINTYLQIHLNAKVLAVVIFFTVSLIPCLWADDRKEYISLDGKAIAVEAGAVNCGPYSIFPSDRYVGKDGGNRNVTVHGGESGCPWTAGSNNSWITVKSGGGNDGNVLFTVDANNGPYREGTITVAGQTFTVKQADGCTQTLSPSNNSSIGFVGGTGAITVSTEMGCNWTATVNNNLSWIVINDIFNGNGNGSVSYTVSANPGGQRTGKIAIGDKEFTITQGENCQLGCDLIGSQCSDPNPDPSSCLSACMDSTGCYDAFGPCITIVGDCVSQCMNNGQNSCYEQANQCQLSCNAQCGYVFSPQSMSGVSSGGTSGMFSVNSAACSWTASSNAQWLKVTAGASGTGNETVYYTVDGNYGPSSARTGKITIAGKDFTLTQAGCSTDSLYPTSANPTAADGSGSVNVASTDASCAWTATTNDSWITITSGGKGTGNGTVNYTFTGNPGTSARYGSMTIGWKTFPITQAPCTYTANAANQNPTAAGGNGSVSVAASGGSCPWTAAKNGDWITITSGGSGAGNGTVNYTIDGNTGPSMRYGSITVGGQTVYISQAGCEYSLSSTSSGTISTTGGSGSFTVNTNNTCGWTTSNIPYWVTITGGNSGTGTGQVSYSVGNNSAGPKRSGTMTTGGIAYMVSQDGMSCHQYCSEMEQPCSGACYGQCYEQIPPECYNYMSYCMPAFQACVDQCYGECSYLYSSCMASCQ